MHDQKQGVDDASNRHNAAVRAAHAAAQASVSALVDAGGVGQTAGEGTHSASEILAVIDAWLRQLVPSLEAGLVTAEAKAQSGTLVCNGHRLPKPSIR